MILIITHDTDKSADIVTEHLKKLSKRFVRLNTEDFPQHIQLVLELNKESMNGQLELKESSIALNEVSCVWNRRQRSPAIDARIKDEARRKWAEQETSQTLSILWSMLQDKFWMNPPEVNERLNFNKWLQMRAAVEAGFEIPTSIITNQPEAAKRFIDKEQGEISMKALKQQNIHYPDGKKTVLLTKKLGKELLTPDNLSRITLTPVFLQRYIEKDFELRVTIVGDQIFTCKIHSQNHNGTKEDWRGHVLTGETAFIEPYKLPDVISEQCLLLVKNLNLSFGCIDIIVTPDGRYVFLEVNPNGQWGWVEQQTKLPIAKAIADKLAIHTY